MGIMNRNDRQIAIGTLLMATLALVILCLIDGADDTSTQQRKIFATHPSRNNEASRPFAYNESEPRTIENFPFDPNTADSTQLLRLGLYPRQIRNIYRYRNKGGVFRVKEDFARIYGLTVKDYRRLEPYICISEDYFPAATLVGKRPRYERDTLLYPIKIDTTQHVILNTADTFQLKRVPGIGSYYAKEIERYGRWLGGYVNVQQLDEIDGFPQEAKRYFIIKHPQPQKLNVNKLSLQQLRRHPYINYYQAKAIVDYRRLYGAIRSLQDLRFSRDFPPEVIQRLEPYVEY